MDGSPARNKLNSALKVLFWVVLIAALIAAARYFNIQELLKSALDWVTSLGPWRPVPFIVIYILATILFIPGSILTLGAGVLFGVVLGSIYVSIGATIGAAGAFLVGRYLARGWVEKRIKGNPKFEAIDQAVAQEGWKIVGLTRLSPVFPFNLLNYAFSVTQVSLKDYFFSTWIGITPGTVLYVYLGSLAGSLTRLGRSKAHTLAEWAFYAVGLIATVAVTIYVTQIAKKALAQRVF
jgi:uncharacterized membrane protein YdjX (TVP38/TMEM64 family)